MVAYELSDIPGKIELGRREFLGALGTTAATSLGSSLENTEAELDKIYGDQFTGFERGQQNVLIDVIEVGDNRLQDDIVDDIAEAHRENGINAVIARRQQKYSEDWFQQEYGGNVIPILGAYGRRGFVHDVAEDLPELDYPVVQSVMSPGKADDPVGWLEDPMREEYTARYDVGFSTDSFALASDKAFQEARPENYMAAKKRAFLHELGHTYGLRHSNDRSRIMYPDIDIDSELDFRPDEWDVVKDNLKR